MQEPLTLWEFCEEARQTGISNRTVEGIQSNLPLVRERDGIGWLQITALADRLAGASLPTDLLDSIYDLEHLLYFVNVRRENSVPEDRRSEER